MHLFGKTVACLALSEILDGNKNLHYRARVENIFMDMRDGFDFLKTAPNRRKFEQFWRLWIAEIKTRIYDLGMPDDTNKFAVAAMYGLARRFRRKCIINAGWSNKFERVEFPAKDEKEGRRYRKRLREVQEKTALKELKNG